MGSLAVLYFLTVFVALWWLTPLMGVMLAVASRFSTMVTMGHFLKIETEQWAAWLIHLAQR